MSKGRNHALIHIGSPKSGSTTLQYFLAANRDCLRSTFRTLYPCGGCPEVAGDRGSGQHLLPNTLRRKAGEIDPESFGRVVDEFNASGCERLLLSAEGLSQLTQPMIEEFSGRLQLDTSATRVIAYFRNPVDYMQSSYNQTLRNGTFCGSAGQYVAENLHQCDYREIVARWCNVFGKENVLCFDYQKASAAGLIAHFCGVAGIQIPAEKRVYRNPSLPARVLPALRFLNRPTIKNHPLGHRIRRHVLRQTQAGKIVGRLLNPLNRHPFSEDCIEFIRRETSGAMSVCQDISLEGAPVRIT